MTPKLNVLAAPAKKQSSAPSVHMKPPVLENAIPFSDLHGKCIHMVYLHTRRKKTHTHTLKVSKYFSFPWWYYLLCKLTNIF